LSAGMKVVYNYLTDSLEECSLNGKEIEYDQWIKIAVQSFHYLNFTEFFDVDLKEVEEHKKARMVITNDFSIFEELLSSTNNTDAQVEGRITIIQ
ncbi:MAG: hypothetical protein IIZ74_07860, partial [Erysipelotrichaceae bacterium]|nr:hypothetical protein [Erysipelotrichaceae bacterium]